MRRVRTFSRKIERTPHPRHTQNTEIRYFPYGCFLPTCESVDFRNPYKCCGFKKKAVNSDGYKDARGVILSEWKNKGYPLIYIFEEWEEWNEG